MRFLFILAFILGVTGASYFFFFRDPSFVDLPRGGKTIIALGDSLVEGVGASYDKDFVALLSVRLGVPIVNVGVGGDTAGTALDRLERDVLSRDPRIVIVLLGGNDALRRLPVATTFSNLGLLIDRVHEAGAGVLLLGVRGGIFGDVYKKQFRELAREKKTSFVPDVLEGVFGNPEFMSDSIHPNDGGYAHIADRVEPMLRKMIVDVVQ